VHCCFSCACLAFADSPDHIEQQETSQIQRTEHQLRKLRFFKVEIPKTPRHPNCEHPKFATSAKLKQFRNPKIRTQATYASMWECHDFQLLDLRMLDFRVLGFSHVCVSGFLKLLMLEFWNPRSFPSWGVLIGRSVDIGVLFVFRFLWCRVFWTCWCCISCPC
jgi:hypothetical protein